MMHRRTFISQSLGAAAIATFAVSAQAAQSASAGANPLPRRKRVRVAFMLGEGANVIDTAGPWEVFQDVMLGMRLPRSFHRLNCAADCDSSITAASLLQVD